MMEPAAQPGCKSVEPVTGEFRVREAGFVAGFRKEGAAQTRITVAVEPEASLVAPVVTTAPVVRKPVKAPAPVEPHARALFGMERRRCPVRGADWGDGRSQRSNALRYADERFASLSRIE